MKWRQFTVYSKDSLKKYFPLSCLDTFLPDFIGINRNRIKQWHFLFEPAVVVRYLSKKPDEVFESAKRIADGYYLIIEPGDKETSSPIEANDFIWEGEAAIYGADRWQAVLQFLEACSNLSLETNRLIYKDQTKAMQKYIHLLCNIHGSGYAEEAVICDTRAKRAMENYIEYGRT